MPKQLGTMVLERKNNLSHSLDVISANLFNPL